jgi:iron complex transport system permease protein
MNRLVVLLLIAVVALAAVVATPFVGIHEIRPGQLLSGSDPVAARIFWQLRLPRVLMAVQAGMALALAGMVFQAMFRNPLATPFTLGVASGASLGASLAILLGLTAQVAWIGVDTWFAFCGALAAIGLVFGLSHIRAEVSAATLLLAGVAVSFCCSSLILLLQYLSDFTRTHRMIRWVMGGLERIVGYDDLLTAAPFVVVGAAIVLWLNRELDMISTGDELAVARGVSLKRVRVTLFLTASVMVGAVVSVCGPIGFVGLMVPHICRLLIGPAHGLLGPATALFGAAFLAACDAVARTAIAPAELPVGIITALLGGPFFLWLLIARGTERIEQ